MKKIFKLFVIFIFSACNKKNNKMQPEFHIKLKLIKKIEDNNISCISRIISNAGYYYVSDWKNNKIYKFSADDELVISFGNQGKGPGEFSKLTDMAIENNRIYVTDQNLNRIQIFDSNGKFIKTIKTEFPNVEIGINKGNIFVNSLSPLFAIYEYDKSGKILNKFGKLKEGKNNFLEMLKNISRFASDGKNIYRILYNSPKIYTITDSAISICYTNNQIKKYEQITFTIENGSAKLNRGSIIHSDIIANENYIFVVGGGGNLKNPKNRLEHFLNVYDKNWHLIGSVWPNNLSYSEDGYSLCKLGKYLYFAKTNENQIYKYEFDINKE